QGLQMNQQVDFLSDGGEDVRQVQLYLNPEAEHLLDWFHVTMRLTVLNQTAKGLPEKVGEDDDPYELRSGVLQRLESIKWYLWHGNTFQALNKLQDLEMDLEAAAFESKNENTGKLLKGVEELHTYVERNQKFVPNYGERYRNGEKIASGFVESAVSQVVGKRMVKRQQMQWTERGAHLLLQIRTRVLNQEWEDTFRRWYPGFRPQTQAQSLEKAA
ncbi:MAG TPA: ISKra4 family transposase, partial [Acidobacteriaceae bacterium]